MQVQTPFYHTCIVQFAIITGPVPISRLPQPVEATSQLDIGDIKPLGP